MPQNDNVNHAALLMCSEIVPMNMLFVTAVIHLIQLNMGASCSLGIIITVVKYNFLNFDSFLFYSDACLKMIHNLTPHPHSHSPSSDSGSRTRPSTRRGGDWVHFRKTGFGQSAFLATVGQVLCNVLFLSYRDFACI